MAGQFGQTCITEIDEGPLDTLAFVLFLLEYEHVVVEELLQLLVSEVNACDRMVSD